MVSFPEYEELIQKIYDQQQEQVFYHWETLDKDERKNLLEDLKNVDFEEFNAQFKSVADKQQTEDLDFNPADYIRIASKEQEKEKFDKAYTLGEEAIRAGRTCAFVVAGGQGSRLGFDGPKGAYKVTPIKRKSLFQIHTEKLLKSSRKYKVDIPLLIMTSQVNYQQTLDHFSDNNFFGLKKELIFMFKQDMIPSMTSEGKLILGSPSSLFRNPNGHGGSLVALKKSGMLDKLKTLGVDLISYFQVDNPAVHIIDPLFVGFHILNQAEISSKAITKAYPQEKVGNFVVFSNGGLGVVEYSDLPDDKAYEKNSDDSLHYSAGSIAIHLFSCDFISRITEDTVALPYHLAEKKLRSCNTGAAVEINGYKFEKFVFDALPLTKKNVILETYRKNEFAPVKNRTGLDSVDSSCQLMMDLHRSWLEERGITIPDSVAIIEISPLAALDAADLDETMIIADDPEVYIE